MLVLKGAFLINFLHQAHENYTLHWRFWFVRDSFLVALKDKQRKNTECGINALAEQIDYWRRTWYGD